MVVSKGRSFMQTYFASPAAALVIAFTVIFVSAVCILFARRRHRRAMAQQGFRYSQV